MQEKLTIAEFAARAGCSPQRVSQLLRKSLKQFQVIENGRKYILSDALPKVLEAREKQGYRKSFETVSETLSNSCETVSISEKVDELTAELEEIRTQLADAQRNAAESAAALDAAQQENRRISAALQRMSADLDAAREQRQKAEIKGAAADAESKRADAAELQCKALQEQLNHIRAELAETAKRAESAAAAIAERDAERRRADAAELKADNLTERLAAIAERQADALRASEARQLIETQPAEDEPQQKKSWIYRLTHRKNG